MEIIYLILKLAAGLFILRGLITFLDWLDERDVQKQLRIKYPPDHPFWDIKI